jgi:cysteine desulfuration protein SufE
MSDKTAFEILDINLDKIFNKLELDEHLSPNRHFGLYAIVELMKQQVTQRFMN